MNSNESTATKQVWTVLTCMYIYINVRKWVHDCNVYDVSMNKCMSNIYLCRDYFFPLLQLLSTYHYYFLSSPLPYPYRHYFHLDQTWHQPVDLHFLYTYRERKRKVGKEADIERQRYCYYRDSFLFFPLSSLPLLGREKTRWKWL